MTAAEPLPVAILLIQALAWPLVALVAIAVLPKQLRFLLPGAKVKLTVAGQSIETTVPELTQLVEETAAEVMTAELRAYLVELMRIGVKPYPDGLDRETREHLRPLRNAGLVLAVPKDVRLAKATGVQLSGLGRLYLRAVHAAG